MDVCSISCHTEGNKKHQAQRPRLLLLPQPALLRTGRHVSSSALNPSALSLVSGPPCPPAHKCSPISSSLIGQTTASSGLSLVSHHSSQEITPKRSSSVAFTRVKQSSHLHTSRGSSGRSSVKAVFQLYRFNDALSRNIGLSFDEPVSQSGFLLLSLKIRN